MTQLHFRINSLTSVITNRLHANKSLDFRLSTATEECQGLIFIFTLKSNAKFRLGAHWQLNGCGDKTVAVNVRALQLNNCLFGQLFFFKYRMDFIETEIVCTLVPKIRNDRRKKTLGTSSSQ